MSQSAAAHESVTLPEATDHLTLTLTLTRHPNPVSQNASGMGNRVDLSRVPPRTRHSAHVCFLYDQCVPSLR